MKRIAMILLALLLAVPALADTMAVVNCEEWVSLREKPDTKSARIAKVPLYAHVEDCELAENGFIRGSYDGDTGYILEKYLEPVEDNEAQTLLYQQVGDVAVSANIFNVDGGQVMKVDAVDNSGKDVWNLETPAIEPTELTPYDAFIAGTKDEPRLMLHTMGVGLESRDPVTGEVIWTLKDADVNLGAGNAHAVDEQGRMYISGYYGPDPVCIDMDGKVLWQASTGSDAIFWPYQITLTKEGVVTEYETMNEGSGRIVYDYGDGHILRIEQE